MYALTGKDASHDIGCLFTMGILLLLTIASLSPFLFPTVSSAGWYVALNWTTDILLFAGFMLIVIPLADRRTKYLLCFILLSCIILQISTFQFLNVWSDNPVLTSTWSIQLRVGYAIFLLGLFIFTFIMNLRRDGRTRENIETNALSISENRVTIGKAFLIHYTLACKKITPIKSVNITFSYQQYAEISLSQGGYSGYEGHTLPVYEKKDLSVYPGSPLIIETDWTIPANLIPEKVSRKDWSLKVRVVLRKGVILEKEYPLKVQWDWSAIS